MAGDRERRTIRLPKAQWSYLDMVARQEGSGLSEFLESMVEGFMIGMAGKPLIDEDPVIAAAYRTINDAVDLVIRNVEERLKEKENEEA